MPEAIDLLEQWAKAWTEHDMHRLAALFVDDFTYEDVTMGALLHGESELVAFGERFISAVPDCSFILASRFTAGQFAGAEWIMTGTQSGPLRGFPPSNKRCRIRGSSTFEIRGGRLSRCSDYWDLVTLLRQLGHLT